MLSSDDEMVEMVDNCIYIASIVAIFKPLVLHHSIGSLFKTLFFTESLSHHCCGNAWLVHLSMSSNSLLQWPQLHRCSQCLTVIAGTMACCSKMTGVKCSDNICCGLQLHKLSIGIVPSSIRSRLFWAVESQSSSILSTHTASPPVGSESDG